MIAQPLISYRLGNSHTYWPHVSEVFFLRWPSLVGSLALSESARRKVRSAEPWRSPGWLLLLRGWGFYSLAEYRRWVRPRLHSIREWVAPALVAVLPGVLVNAFFVFYFSIHGERGRWLPGMKRSPFYFRNWQVFRRAA